MKTFNISSIIKKFMQYAAHPMLAISFKNSKRIMLVTEYREKQLMFKCLEMISIIGLEE